VQSVQRYARIRPVTVSVDAEYLSVTLKDGRIISTPLDWYPWLRAANDAERQRVELLPDGVYWPDLDEGLEIEGMLQGLRPAVITEPA
jgi:hypothetical protein